MTRRPRYLLEAAASLRPLEGGVEQPASVRDLSEWGLGLRGAGLRSPGEPLQVRFALPDGPAIRLIGAVVWARSIAGESRCGVRIQALPVADLLTLREHLEREAAGQPA